jgi:hypothetical protein
MAADPCRLLRVADQEHRRVAIHHKGAVPSQKLHRQEAAHLSPRSHTMATMVAFSTLADSRSAALMAPPEDTPAKIPAHRGASCLVYSNNMVVDQLSTWGQLAWCQPEAIWCPVPAEVDITSAK